VESDWAVAEAEEKRVKRKNRSHLILCYFATKIDKRKGKNANKIEPVYHQLTLCYEEKWDFDQNCPEQRKFYIVDQKETFFNLQELTVICLKVDQYITL
jgi:hypothetical protein